MKKFLIERYPLVWNSKLLPMLGLAACGHFIFFLLGYAIDKGDASDKYYTIGEGFFFLPFLLHLIVSILLLVFWLMQLSKNNAFKHFYPSDSAKLLGMFTQYFVIVLSVLTFSFSFMEGERLHLMTLANKIVDDSSYPYLLQGLLLASLFISLLVFCVRITEMRTLLLTIVFSGVLSMVLSVVSVSILGVIGDLLMPVFWMYIALPFIAMLIVVTQMQVMPKLFSGILINFSLLFFTPALYGMVFSLFEEKAFDSMSVVNYSVLIINFAFIGVYAPVLHQWRAAPE